MSQDPRLFKEIKAFCDDPQFLRRVFMAEAKKLKEDITDPLERVIAEEFGSFSTRLERSKFQNASLVRHLVLGRKIAQLLISDQGELALDILDKAILLLKKHAYSLGPGWEEDAPRQEHLISALSKLREEKALQRLIRRIAKPHSHKVAEQVLRDTLLLPDNEPVTDAVARRAVLSAWFCQLRQNVGSCFATAPAILVQREQPEQFLKDMDELLSTGALKRVAGGVEYSVPFALSSGAGDLRRQIPLTAELAASLGLSPGLIAAFEAGGLINPEHTLKRRTENAQRIAEEVLDKQAPFVTAEELIRKAMLMKCGISEKDLKEFYARPKGMIYSGLMLSVPSSGAGMGGKGEACSQFLHLFERAKSAFKAMQENALLKIWEFTLASFAETKPGFTRWNMYASLGFNSDEQGGIGACLYAEIKELLDRANARMQEVQYEYELLYSQLKMCEGRMRNVSSEKEAQWLRIDYESKRNEFYSLGELRDKLHFQAERFANLLSDLLDAYDALFPRYFQEVYDPDMHEVSVGPYEDSPAGFRLLYKHGRSNTAQWSMIYTPDEFVEALASFFVSTESEIVNSEKFKGLQQELSDLVSRLVAHVRSQEFLLTALQRMAKAHQVPLIKDPLDNLEKVEKKPWAYTSGGTMDNLISCYFKLDRKPLEKGRWVENEMELLLFLVDLVKQMPQQTIEEATAPSGRSLLMHSPTHAFSLMPSFKEFRDTVQQDVFPYTYVRDAFVKPAQQRIDFFFLNGAEQEELLKRLSEELPDELKPRLLGRLKDLSYRMNPIEFRSALSLSIEQDRALSYFLSKARIDSFLFETLPLAPITELRSKMEALLSQIPGFDEEIVRKIAEHRGDGRYISASQLQELCKAAVIFFSDATSIEENYPLLIARKAEQLGYALSTPFRFADTNWTSDYFAFVVNPGTGALDFWRVNYSGTKGFPMSSWRIWLDGSRKDRTWGVYTKPHEYRLT